MALSQKEGDKGKEIKIMGEKIPEMEERTQQTGEILFKDMSEKLSRPQGRPQSSAGHITC